MASYHFRLFNHSGRYVIGHFVQCEDDIQAQAHAQQLLARRGIVNVEVRSAGRLVHQAKKRGRSRSSAKTPTVQWTRSAALESARQRHAILSVAIACIEQDRDDGRVLGNLVEYLSGGRTIRSVADAIKRAGFTNVVPLVKRQ